MKSGSVGVQSSKGSSNLSHRHIIDAQYPNRVFNKKDRAAVKRPTDLVKHNIYKISTEALCLHQSNALIRDLELFQSFHWLILFVVSQNMRHSLKEELSDFLV